MADKAGIINVDTGGIVPVADALVETSPGVWQLQAAAPGYVPATRRVDTSAPLTGGGDLSANRTISMPAATVASDGYATAAQITAIGTAQSTATAAAAAAAAAQAIANAAVPKSLATATDQGLYSTGVGAWAAATLTAFGRSVWAAVDAAAFRAIVTYSKSDVGLSAVDNVQQMPLSYLDTSTSLGTSNVKVPSQNAVKVYADTKAALTGAAFTGAVSITNAAVATLLAITSNGVGELPIKVRTAAGNPAEVGAQAGMDFGFSDTYRVTFATAATSGVGTQFNGAAYFHVQGMANGLRFITFATSQPIESWQSSNLRTRIAPTNGVFQLGRQVATPGDPVTGASTTAGTLAYFGLTGAQCQLRLGDSGGECWSFGRDNVSSGDLIIEQTVAAGTAVKANALRVYNTTGIVRATWGLEVFDLTSGRLVIAGANGRMTGDSGLTFVTAILSTPKLALGSGTTLTKAVVYTPSLTPANVGATTTAEETYTVAGLTTGDTVTVNVPGAVAGMGLVGARVSAADTLALTWLNLTAAPKAPPSGTFRVLAVRS